MGPEIVGTWQQREFLWVNEWEGFVSYEVLGKKWWLYGKRGSLGGQMTKEGCGLIRMRVETVGYGKRERQFGLVGDMGEIMVFQCLVADKQLS